MLLIFLLLIFGETSFENVNAYSGHSHLSVQIPTSTYDQPEGSSYFHGMA